MHEYVGVRILLMIMFLFAEMSTAVSTSPLSLMSCVRESSPSHDTSSDLEVEKNGKKIIVFV